MPAGAPTLTREQVNHTCQAQCTVVTGVSAHSAVVFSISSSDSYRKVVQDGDVCEAFVPKVEIKSLRTPFFFPRSPPARRPRCVLSRRYVRRLTPMVAVIPKSVGNAGKWPLNTFLTPHSSGLCISYNYNNLDTAPPVGHWGLCSPSGILVAYVHASFTSNASRYPEAMGEEQITASRKLSTVTGLQDMAYWILGDPTVNSLVECAEYVAGATASGEDALFAHDSELASFQIMIPGAVIRL